MCRFYVSLALSGLIFLVSFGCAFYSSDYQWNDIPESKVASRYPIPDHDEYLRFKQEHYAEVSRLDSILTFHDIYLPVERLLQQGSDWEDLNLPPYAMPQDSELHNILPTLRLVQEQIVPLVGEVIIVSGYRTREYNERAGGADRSRHLFFDGIDMAPLTKIPERILKNRLREFWYEKGERYNLGLGLYDHKRFHIDTWKYRNWGNWPGVSE